MKLICWLLLFAIPLVSISQNLPKAGNVFIITTDGFRWQEVFTGADAAMIDDQKYTADPFLTKAMYWDDEVEQRRKKLMPFFWNVIAEKGQLYGNRLFDNKVNFKNIYKISYPGYNELLTGYADPRFIPNTKVPNRNTNILEYLNQQPAYAGKVAAFTSWNVFPYILNETRSNFPVNSGYELQETEDSLSGIDLINQVQENVRVKEHTRHDMLTYLTAREYIKDNHPKALFLSLGETDESAHSNHYDAYLQQAAAVDNMIAQLWYYVQTDPFYKDNTTFIITTDHGRGATASSWHTHGIFTKGSGDSWLAMIGPGITPAGEVKEEQQLYSNQLVSTIAFLLGQKFETTHRIGKPLKLTAPAKEHNTITVSR